MRRFLLSLSLVALLPAQSDVAEAGVSTTVYIQRVIDGDTIVTRKGVRIRLIGVDTPETVYPGRPIECFGPEASAFTERHLEGDRVGLEYDIDRKDRYGRTLAYIHDKDFPGRIFQWSIIRRGFGLAKHYAPNYKYRALLDEAQRRAASENRGLWGKCGGQA